MTLSDLNPIKDQMRKMIRTFEKQKFDLNELAHGIASFLTNVLGGQPIISQLSQVYDSHIGQGSFESALGDFVEFVFTYFGDNLSACFYVYKLCFVQVDL